MYGPKVYFVVFQRGNFTMPILCVLPNFISSPYFRCCSISVSGMHKFNRKKEKKMMKMAIFKLTLFPSNFKLNLAFDGMVTMMSLKVQMNAY